MCPLEEQTDRRQRGELDAENVSEEPACSALGMLMDPIAETQNSAEANNSNETRDRNPTRSEDSCREERKSKGGQHFIGSRRYFAHGCRFARPLKWGVEEQLLLMPGESSS